MEKTKELAQEGLDKVKELAPSKEQVKQVGNAVMEKGQQAMQTAKEVYERPAEKSKELAGTAK